MYPKYVAVIKFHLNIRFTNNIELLKFRRIMPPGVAYSEFAFHTELCNPKTRVIVLLHIRFAVNSSGVHHVFLSSPDAEDA